MYVVVPELQRAICLLYYANMHASERRCNSYETMPAPQHLCNSLTGLCSLYSQRMLLLFRRAAGVVHRYSSTLSIICRTTVPQTFKNKMRLLIIIRRMRCCAYFVCAVAISSAVLPGPFQYANDEL